jgi:hypothetical protein
MKKKIHPRLIVGLIADLLALAGVILVSLGVSEIYPPAGLIVLGVLLLLLGVGLARNLEVMAVDP